MTKSVIITCLLVALAAPAMAADSTSADQVTGLTASYTATLSFGENAPVLPFHGELALAGDRLRISVSQDITLEEYIALVNYKADTLTLLYPDTLNGQRYKLSTFDHLNGFSRIRDVLTGKPPQVPAGWKTAELKDQELNGETCKHHTAKKEGGASLEWWTRGDGLPVQAQLIDGDTKVAISITAYERQAQINPALFAISKDYTITEAKDGVPDGLPSL